MLVLVLALVLVLVVVAVVLRDWNVDRWKMKKQEFQEMEGCLRGSLAGWRQGCSRSSNSESGVQNRAASQWASASSAAVDPLQPH